MAILEAAVTAGDANLLRWIQETALQQTAFKRKEATLNTCCTHRSISRLLVPLDSHVYLEK
jgi:hypothetical protein